MKAIITFVYNVEADIDFTIGKNDQEVGEGLELEN